LVFVIAAILVSFLFWLISKIIKMAPADSDLEIEFIQNNPKPAKKHPCQIRIRNKNPAKNADDLKVEIVSFTSELSAEQAVYYHPEFPYFLKLDSKSKTINPLDSIVIAGFDFESASKIEGREQKFVAGFDLEKSDTGQSRTLPPEKNMLCSMKKRIIRLSSRFPLEEWRVLKKSSQ
jgi:hypothetical protein